MTLFEGLNSKITSDATLQSIGPLTKVYPQSVPPNPVYPWALMRRISGAGIVSHDGDDGLNRVRIEITVYDDNVKRAEKLVSRLRIMFKGFNGLLGGTGGVRLACGAFGGPRSVFHPETRSQGLQLDILGLLDESTVS